MMGLNWLERIHFLNAKEQIHTLQIHGASFINSEDERKLWWRAEVANEYAHVQKGIPISPLDLHDTFGCNL